MVKSRGRGRWLAAMAARSTGPIWDGASGVPAPLGWAVLSCRVLATEAIHAYIQTDRDTYIHTYTGHARGMDTWAWLLLLLLPPACLPVCLRAH